MKEKKHTQPSPIIFNINNIDANAQSFGGIFSIIDFMLYVEESGVHGFFDYMKTYFTPEHFRLLNKRIANKRNKEVPMNQQHLIIFYSTLHLLIQVLASEKEVKLMDIDFEDTKAMLDIKTATPYLIDFSISTIKTLKRDYKNNNTIIVAFAKIDTYKIS